MIDIDLKLSAQRALLSNVPKNLRAASIEVKDNKIIWKCIFDSGATEEEIELLDCAATEIIADFHDKYTIEEVYETTPYPNEMTNLKLLVYLRYEE